MSGRHTVRSKMNQLVDEYNLSDYDLSSDSVFIGDLRGSNERNTKDIVESVELGELIEESEYKSYSEADILSEEIVFEENTFGVYHPLEDEFDSIY